MEKIGDKNLQQKNSKTLKNNSSRASMQTSVEASLRKFYGSLGRFLSESSQLGKGKGGSKPLRICSNHVCPHAPKDVGRRTFICNEPVCPYRVKKL